MEKRTKPARRRPKAPRKNLIEVEVPGATRKQLAELKKLFRTKVVSELGVEPRAVITKERFATTRKRGR